MQYYIYEQAKINKLYQYTEHHFSADGTCRVVYTFGRECDVYYCLQCVSRNVDKKPHERIKYVNLMRMDCHAIYAPYGILSGGRTRKKIIEDH